MILTLYIARYSLSFQPEPYNFEELKHSPFDAWFCISLYHSLLQSRAPFCMQISCSSVLCRYIARQLTFHPESIWSEPDWFAKLHDDASVISKGKKWYFSMSWKTCPVKFEQTLQETNLFCWRVNTPAWPFKILRRKLKYWIQTFYFHDKQFRSSLNVYKTLDSILLFISYSSSRAFKQLFLWYCRSRYALGFKLQKLKFPQNSVSYSKEVLRWICSDWFLIGNGH